MRLLLVIILVTQMGCSFVVSAAGSLVGNLGADYIEEKIKEKDHAIKEGEVEQDDKQEHK